MKFHGNHTQQVLLYNYHHNIYSTKLAESITSLLPSVLLQMCSTNIMPMRNKGVMFSSSIAWYYGDIDFIMHMKLQHAQLTRRFARLAYDTDFHVTCSIVTDTDSRMTCSKYCMHLYSCKANCMQLQSFSIVSHMHASDT